MGCFGKKDGEEAGGKRYCCCTTLARDVMV
jgi:hypothetical protein